MTPVAIGQPTRQGLVIAQELGVAGQVADTGVHAAALVTGQAGCGGLGIDGDRDVVDVDGTVVSSSMALLLESRCGRRGGVLLWTLLIVASLASLAANVAVAEPTLIGRVIAAWPSC
jgi:hypothetical protein